MLKRMFSLAKKEGKFYAEIPHFPMLREANARSGFFEPDVFNSLLKHLPDDVQPIVQFAYITGWRVNSEVLPLEWHQVDFAAGTVRLLPGTTKNGEGRVFPMSDALRSLLEDRRRAADVANQAGHIVPWVFFRMVAKGCGGTKYPKPIRAFGKAWKKARVAAGCPGRIPHDLRRTAVRNLVRVGIPERVAMQMTGHKTRSVFERYNIVSEGDVMDAVRRLNDRGLKKLAQ